MFSVASPVFAAFSVASICFAYDSIGNRTRTTEGGDVNGGNLRSESYTANNLNQYTSRSNADANDIIGAAYATASVEVNGNSVQNRKGEYFDYALTGGNSSTAMWQAVTNTATQGSNTESKEGGLLLPPLNQGFTYDEDGNLLSDGVWSYTWDTANRLISMTSLLDSSAPNSARNKLDFAYDYQGRRIAKIVSTWNGSAYANPSTNLYAYDGWNLLGELNGTNRLVRSYAWGLDLSGTLDQAGGIGGLLVLTDEGINHFVAYDGNGNVTALVKEDGSVSAQYQYSPFGQQIRATGPLSKANPFRWSTKFWDEESGLSYYGLRFYSSEQSRWLGKDPIGEKGGRNLYAFVDNDPIATYDPFGSNGNTLETEVSGAQAASLDSSAGSQASNFLREVQSWAEEFNDFQRAENLIVDNVEGGDDLLITLYRAGEQRAASFGGNNASARLGKIAHELYQPGEGYQLNRAIPGSKMRPDAIDYVNKIVRELKPFTKRGIQRGAAQMKKYLDLLNKAFPEGGEWTGIVDYY
jgi:RHS repeat-associated protein